MRGRGAGSRHALLSSAGLTLVLALAAPAAGSPATATAKEEPKSTFGHQGQFELRAGVAAAYEMLFRYDHSPPCAPWDASKKSSDQQKFCGVGAPPMLDVALSYSFVDAFEPFLFGRFGLGEVTKTNSGAPLVVGAGARIYTMSEDRFKIFFSPWVALDLTSGPASNSADFAPYGSTTTDYKTDVLLHIDAGPQIEISRVVGVYAAGGLTFGMLRYLRTDAELTLGVQLRAP